jgi:AcrR family transcriptional regulator
MTTADEETSKPLRRDAERNRQRILDAARELFAERGLSATLNEIAHHAGVGVGTVYRRYPDKAVLIDELFEQRLAEVIDLLDTARGEPDPWQGLIHFMTRMLELQAADQGLKELLLGFPGALERTGRMRELIYPRVNELVTRAHAAGQLRADVEAPDMPVIQLMIGAVIDIARDIEPELWRRFFELVIQGLRATPEEPRMLEPGPLTPDEVQQALASWQPDRR